MQFNVTVTLGFISNAINSIYQHTNIFSNAWYCIKCFEDIIPFSNISNDKLCETNVGKKIKFKALTRKQNFQNQDIIEKLNNAMDDPEAEILSSKYFEPHELARLLKNKESISFFYLNISSLPFHLKEFSTLLSTYKLPFDLLGITESRLRINKLPLTQVQLPDYNFESTPTESSKGGTAIYIRKTLNYKLRKDLIIYKPNQLDSTFIEITQNKETYRERHPSLEISGFNKHYLSNLIETLSLENKKLSCLVISMLTY